MVDPEYLAIASSDAVGDDQTLALSVKGCSVLLVRSLGIIHAIENRCPHAEQPLEGGRVKRGWIGCPFHGARFDLETGEPLNPPATSPLRRFPVREADGVIAVAVQDEAG